MVYVDAAGKYLFANVGSDMSTLKNNELFANITCETFSDGLSEYDEMVSNVIHYVIDKCLKFIIIYKFINEIYNDAAVRQHLWFATTHQKKTQWLRLIDMERSS